ncbi:rap guanine nucleotide exchange factor 4 isoform X4 [Paramuricea clavata]|uniref:Rap guanine nucleotide exchange factor 4 isoform X4 n=1 Tax=Paramuricea clavata TaxID=317549 RepID=A0A7D9HY17_PARCT|nr:rap guanine nucleotide exchange factor 4 isoform X4 [Paramuricea clavata]
MSTYAMRQSESAAQESASRANTFEASFDNFKTKRRRTFSGRGKYFTNVKQFFNGCKNRVRSLRERSMYDVGCQFVKKEDSVDSKVTNQETSTSFEKDSIIVRFDHKDVLILDRKKDPSLVFSENEVDPKCYDVTTGLPETVLEYLLETRLGNDDDSEGNSRDTLVDDFLLTFPLFMNEEELCSILKRYYRGTVRIQHAFPSNEKKSPQDIGRKRKQRLVRFILRWNKLSYHIFYENEHVKQLLKGLVCDLEKDNLPDELSLLEQVLDQTCNHSRFSNGYDDLMSSALLENKDSSDANHSDKSRVSLDDELMTRLNDCYPIKACDNVIFQVYRSDHTYSKFRCRRDSTVRHIIKQCCEKWRIDDECILCELKSNGEKQVFKYDDIGIVSRVSVNGRLFVIPKEELDCLVPLPEQDGPENEIHSSLTELSAKELAYHLTIYENQLFRSVSVYEFLYHVFGVRNFPGKVTTNLDLFLNRLDEIQFWVATELALASHISKRVQLMKKFIKIAAHCKDFKNWNTFFAIILGLNNSAVSRMNHTWERLPTKFRKMFDDFSGILNPSRNHRVYRLSMGSLDPPIIPFLPLFIKDMTFAHEGSETLTNDQLVNFTKMRLVASTLRLIQFCRSNPLTVDPPTISKGLREVYKYVRQLQVIDNQERLDQLALDTDFKPSSPTKSQTL